MGHSVFSRGAGGDGIERLNLLRCVVFANHEVVPREAGDDIALLIGDHRVEDDVAGGGIERGRDVAG